MKSIALLNIVSPGLTSGDGHDLHYTWALTKALGRIGVGVVVHRPIGPQLGQGCFEERFWPLKDLEPQSSLSGRVRNRWGAWRRASVLRAIVASAAPGEGVLVHTAGFRDLEAVADARCAGEAALLFRFDHYDQPDAVRSLRHSVARAGKTGKRLLSDSLDLAEDFHALSGRRFVLVHPPVAHVAGPLASKPREASLTIGYAGSARRQKGFHRLPTLFDEIKRVHTRVHFLVQAYIHPGDEHDAEICSAAAALRARGDVTYVGQVVDQAAYVTLLSRCDVVLCPYDAAVYRKVTSGVFGDALAAGASVLTTSGTWMAREAEREQLERVTLLDGDVTEALQKAILARQANAPNIERWTGERTYDALARSILGILSE